MFISIPLKRELYDNRHSFDRPVAFLSPKRPVRSLTETQYTVPRQETSPIILTLLNFFLDPSDDSWGVTSIDPFIQKCRVGKFYTP